MARALSSSGYRADFSLESLREVDRFLEEQAPGGKPKQGGLLSEDFVDYGDSAFNSQANWEINALSP
jgi:hypothetical protein